MRNVSSKHPTRNPARLITAGAALLLTLSCLASPCAASEREARGVDRTHRLVPRLAAPDVVEEQKRPEPPIADDPSEPEDRVVLEEEPPPATAEDMSEPEDRVVLEEERSRLIAKDFEEDDDPVEFERNVEVAPTARKIWYGWQNLAVDGVGQTLAFSLGVVRAHQDGGALGMGTGLTTYALGGPIVHFAHGNVGKGFGSLGLRLGLPPAGFIAGGVISGIAMRCEGEPWCGVGGALFGLAFGTAGAITIDAAALAYKEVPREDTAMRSGGTKSLTVLPSLSPSGGGLSVNGLF